MSSYKNFTKEFPKRCSDLLKVYPVAKWADREVTLMLSVASAGLTMPIERLKNKNYPYPFHDRAKFPKAQAEFDNLISSSFLTSPLVDPTQSWYYGALATVVGEPDSWQEFQNPLLLTNTKTITEVTSHIRNALAHGSIHTKGDPISEIIFIASEKLRSPNFYYLMVKPNDFLAFLKKWFALLETMDFSP